MTSNTIPSGIASASSEISAEYRAWKAFAPYVEDGYKCWQSNGSPINAWLQYKFEKPVMVKRMFYQNRYSTAPNQSKDFVIVAPNDGTTWDTLGFLVIDEYGIGVVRWFNFTNNTYYSYYRFIVKSLHSGSTTDNVTIGCLNFYGRSYY